MKFRILLPGVVAVTACFLTGCGQSSSTSNEKVKNEPSSAPPATLNTGSVPEITAKPMTPATAPAPTPASPPAVATTPADSPTAAAAVTPAASDSAASLKGAAVEPVSQFATTAAAQKDKVAASIGSDLAAKAKALTQSAAGNSDLKTQVTSALQSLSAGKDASALGSLFQQTKQASLTPQQMQLTKDVGNLASAYVVQRNFSSVDGAQGDVATIVNSLRQGSVMPAVPALQSLAQNANLTSQQKDLLGTLADQYAPGLKKTSDSLKQGLQSLQGLTK